MNPHLGRAVVVRGDARHLPLPDASIDAIVTDPPYGLEFMGKDWDSFKPSGARIRTRVDGRTNPAEGKSTVSTPEAYVAGVPFQSWCTEWAREAYRVLKPGGHMVAFGGTRTWHRMVCAVEDAGFEIRDALQWLYGSGFPKSLDVSKAIDRRRDDLADIRRVAEWLRNRMLKAGVHHRRVAAEFKVAESMVRHWIGKTGEQQTQCPTWQQWGRLRELIGFGPEMDAEVWRLNGRKGQPGEAWADREVIGERRTGVGAGRGAVPYIGDGNRDVTAPATPEAAAWVGWGTALKPGHEPIILARKPLSGTVAANVLAHGTGALNVDACRTPVDSGDPNIRTSGAVRRSGGNFTGTTYNNGKPGGLPERGPTLNHDLGRWPTNVVLSHAPLLDEDGEPDGDACADGCMPGCPVAELDAQNSGASRFYPTFRYEAKAPGSERPTVHGVAHPTVKPVPLMAWLVRLITPPGGTVLDMFAGTGPTGEAARREGFNAVLIEKDPIHLPLIRRRFDQAQVRNLKPVKPPVKPAAGQADLFADGEAS